MITHIASENRKGYESPQSRVISIDPSTMVCTSEQEEATIENLTLDPTIDDLWLL